ncbi:pilus assembly protein FimV [Pseudoduganella lurida]|uniref:Pilus assembly protein FimV n=1 Tax=Pseudoduganella lurida TaxID=1036180 RepID=A0A562R8A1_9BURK|nr:hypothetical protein [Pseudoduganella lurida]TWI65298.1 pilus assembly protein FimV [Pseudoduganella lurida]
MSLSSSSARRLAALALAAATTGVLAAEPGDATVRSYSGQPLVADIELTDLTPQDLVDLQARLARQEVFEGANVKMNPALAGATFSIVKRDQRRVLHVTTAAPVQGELLHLFFQLSAGGKDRTRSVTLWLSPDPNPPAKVAAAPVVAVPAIAPAAPVRAAAEVTPAKNALPVERAVAARAPKERAAVPKAAAETGKRPILTAEMLREAVAKYSSTASDFKRGTAKPKPVAAAKELVAEAEPAAETKAEEKTAAKPAAKPASRMQLASREELAEAARATKAGLDPSVKLAEPKKPAVAEKVEAAKHVAVAEKAEAAKPVAVAGKAEAAKPVAVADKGAPAKPAAPKQDDAAMLNKLAELEGKLKTLQALVKEGGAALPAGTKAVAAAVAAPAAAHAATPSVTPAVAHAATPSAAPAGGHAAAPSAASAGGHASAAATAPAAIAAKAPAAGPARPPVAEHETASVPAHPATSEASAKSEGAVAKPEAHAGEAGHAVAEAPREEAKPKAPPKVAPPPVKEPEKEMKISRPKILTFLFAASLVLLAIFGVIVHFIRKARNKRSPIVRQSWSRDEDDDAPRVEPVAEAAPPEDIPKAA